MDNIKLRDIVVSYQKNVVLKIPELSLPVHKLVAVVGPNGGGKTTLLRVLFSRDIAHAGDVQFPACARSFVYMAQGHSERKDFPLTVEDYMSVGLYGEYGPFSTLGEKALCAIYEGLAQVRLEGYHKRLLHQLSGGEWQRVQLARFLLLDSQGYILDEPFSAVDRRMIFLMQERLKKLRNLGKTIFVVTHDLSSVKDFFDYVILLRGGVIAQGAPAQVLTPENLEKAYG